MSARILVVMTTKREPLAGEAPGRWRAERRLRGEGFPGWETTALHRYTFCVRVRPLCLRGGVSSCSSPAAVGASVTGTLRSRGGRQTRSGHRPLAGVRGARGTRAASAQSSLCSWERPRGHESAPGLHATRGGCSAGRVVRSRGSYVFSFLRGVLS